MALDFEDWIERLTGLWERLGTLWRTFIESGFWALVAKETSQLLRNRELLFMLLFPPAVQIVLYGIVLSPNVHGVPLGIADMAQVPASRELVSALVENGTFKKAAFTDSQMGLESMLRQGEVRVGIFIPPDFNRNLHGRKTASVQFLVNGTDAYESGVVSAYITQIVYQFNKTLATQPITPMVSPQVTFLYNPGLLTSWFFVPDVMGAILTLICALSAAAEAVKEKDVGTLEQLLMTPVSSLEILLAKILPLFLLLLGEVLLCLLVGILVFKVPFQGNLFLFLVCSSIYLQLVISIGLLLATIYSKKQQVILTAFFITLPLIILSGVFAPIESMPPLLQLLSQFDPLRHYLFITRGILLKGAGLEILWPNILYLFLLATGFLLMSATQYRTQLK